MYIDNEEKMAENLSDIGYFRLGFYLFPFEKNISKKREIIYSKKGPILTMQ